MDKKELMEQLDALKNDLKAATTQEMKSQIEAKMAELKEKLDAIETQKKDIKDLQDWKVTKDEADKKNQEALDKLIAKDGQPGAKAQTKDFNTMLAEGIKENADKITNLKKGNKVEFEMKSVADMGFSTHFSTADASVTQVRSGIIPYPSRKLHIRQLFNIGGMGTSNYAYVKESGGEEGPETVAENSAKNQFDIDLTEASVPAEYIAGYIVISRKMLDDVQGMTTFLQGRLLEKLLRVEDDQLLNGDGTSPNLSGINDTGNFTAASTSETNDANQLIDAIAQLEDLDREANGILLHPQDYWNLAKTTNLNQSQVVTIAEDGVLRIGGVPVFRSTACAEDQYIVGDWTMGADLLVREAPKVEFFYEDSTNVRSNKVTVRVEERVALAIYGNDYFIVGDFGNVS